MASLLRLSVVCSVVLLLSSSVAIGKVVKTVDIAKGLIGVFTEQWNIIENLETFATAGKLKPDEYLNNINRAIRELDAKVQVVDEKVSMISLQIRHIVQKNWSSYSLNAKLEKLADLITKIDIIYRQMLIYELNLGALENTTKLNFATKATSQDFDGLKNMVEKLHTLTTPSTNSGLTEESIYNILVHAMEDSDDHMWMLIQSKHQLLCDLFESLLLTEIKGNAVLQFSWMLLKLYGIGNFTQEAEIEGQRYKERTAVTLASFKSALSGASRVIWRSDPIKHVEGETYVEVTRFLQGYVINEIDLNVDETCSENCDYYQHTKSYGCYAEEFCSQQPPCRGKIHSCRNVDPTITICLAPKESNRIYEWVEYEDRKVLGENKWCPRKTSKAESWWKWLFWRCSYCLCICDQSGSKSDIFFSLLEVKSNVTSNKVVVGLRFAKVDRVIHLQISEGVILSGGLIDKKTITWQLVNTLDVRQAKLDVDFHQLSYEQRTIDLDDLEGPAGHVLTGVRFKKIGSHLSFQIQTTPFNYETGQLDPHRQMWHSTDNTKGWSSIPRKKLHLDKPDIPTKSYNSVITSKDDNKYINFENTDLDADFGQTTVPFIDVQEVMSRNPMALSGAGIYHKSTLQSGGFIGLKIFTSDFTREYL